MYKSEYGRNPYDMEGYVGPYSRRPIKNTPQIPSIAAYVTWTANERLFPPLCLAFSSSYVLACNLAVRSILATRLEIHLLVWYSLVWYGRGVAQPWYSVVWYRRGVIQVWCGTVGARCGVVQCGPGVVWYSVVQVWYSVGQVWCGIV